MSRKRYTSEQIISMLREAEVALAQGQSVGQACRTLGVSEPSYYRWRKEYGGLRTDQANLSSWLPWSMSEERRRELMAPA